MRQLKRLQDKTIPKEVSRFKDIWEVSQEEYNKIKQYSYEKMQFGILHEIFQTSLVLLTLYLFIYPWMNEISYQWADKVWSSEYILLRGLILIF